MEVITKELILKGIQCGVIELITDPNMESGTVAKIGEYWFYFGGITAEEESPEEYRKHVPDEDIARKILEALEGIRDDLGDDAEYGYYASVLRESIPEDGSTDKGSRSDMEKLLTSACAFIRKNHSESQVAAYLGDSKAAEAIFAYGLPVFSVGIIWDTDDGDDDEEPDLPAAVEVNAKDLLHPGEDLETISRDELADRIADHLSDTYGYCVSSLTIEGGMT